ncbi:WecB/TagA/CpsF family glycosyltransferase [Actinomycetota bacterium]
MGPSRRPSTDGLTDQQRPLFGLPFDALTLAQVIELCDQAVRERSRLLIGVANAAKIVNLRSDARLRESLEETDILMADGQSVVWASRLLRQPLPERVAGIDIFTSLLGLAGRKGYAVYFLGARPDVVKTVVEVATRDYPGLRVAGHRDGYFTDGESAEVADEIRRSGADMLFLGITSPKKEIFLGTYGPELGVPVLHGVGGSFDILAGLTKRAPLAWQRAGMEWAYRLAQEPRRLGKRYLVTNTKFLALTAREAVSPSALVSHPPAPSSPPSPPVAPEE